MTFICGEKYHPLPEPSCCRHYEYYSVKSNFTTYFILSLINVYAIHACYAQLLLVCTSFIIFI